MCKHILNAQVQIRAACCKRWFDCSTCHSDVSDHDIQRTAEMVFGCKKCRKVFRKDTTNWDESDEFCPGCDNRYYIPAETPDDAMVFASSISLDEERKIDPRLKLN